MHGPRLSGAEPVPNQGRAFGALRYRDFRLFWMGAVISQVGTWMQQIAQAWLIYDLTGSAFLVGLVGLVRIVPFIGMSLYAGAVVDRVDRRKLLLRVETLNMITTTCFAILVASGHIQVWHVFVTSTIYALVGAFENPSQSALLPHLVPRQDLMTALSLQSVVRKGSQIIGPALGGVTVAAFGVAGAFFINAASYLVQLWCLWSMRTTNPPADHEPQRATDAILAGFRYIASDRVILGLMVLEVVLSIFGSFNTMLVVFAREVFFVGPEAMGLMQSAPGAGSLLGSLVLSAIGDVRHKGRLILFGGVLYGLAVLTFAFSPWFSMAVPVLFVVGAADIMVGATRTTILQLSVRRDMLGRVMSVNAMTTRGLGSLGGFEAGTLATFLGIRWAIAIGALVCLTATIVVSFAVPPLRTFMGSGEGLPSRGGRRNGAGDAPAVATAPSSEAGV